MHSRPVLHTIIIITLLCASFQVPITSAESGDETITVNHVVLVDTPPHPEWEWNYSYQIEVSGLQIDIEPYTAVILIKRVGDNEWEGLDWWWDDIESDGEQFNFTISVQQDCYYINASLYQSSDLQSNGVENATIMGFAHMNFTVGNVECGNVENDSDGDGVPDNSDQCEGYDDSIDVDNDGIPDGCDSLISQENAANYSFDEMFGFDFNGVHYVMNGTYVPTTVAIYADDDEGPYNSSYMLAVTFHTDGHLEDEADIYIPSPEYGAQVEVTDYAFITDDTTYIEVSMEVLTCLNNPCDMTVPASERFEENLHSQHSMTNTNTGDNIPQVVDIIVPEPVGEDGIPRYTFEFDDNNILDADGFWRITVIANQADLATQEIDICVSWLNANGELQSQIWNLADPGVYGFNPTNSISMVTFYDQVNLENGNIVSTFGTGDTIFVRAHDTEGTFIEDAGISVAYRSHLENYDGAILRSWGGVCSYDWDGDGVGSSDVFPFDPTEQADSDDDEVGDNSDEFPNDASESIDSDGDGVGDNSDEFPNDASESIDSDGDGVGDNSDEFPNDANESIDSDNDGIGDNAHNSGNNTPITETKSAFSDNLPLMATVGIAILVISVIGVLVLRKSKTEDDDLLEEEDEVDQITQTSQKSTKNDDLPAVVPQANPKHVDSWEGLPDGEWLENDEEGTHWYLANNGEHWYSTDDGYRVFEES